MMILPTEELTLLGGYKLVLRNTANTTDWKVFTSGGSVTDPVMFTFSLSKVVFLFPMPIMSWVKLGVNGVHGLSCDRRCI